MFKTNFSGVQQNLGDTAPECPHPWLRAWLRLQKGVQRIIAMPTERNHIFQQKNKEKHGKPYLPLINVRTWRRVGILNWRKLFKSIWTLWLMMD